MTEDINAQYAQYADAAPVSSGANVDLILALAQLQLDRQRVVERVEEELIKAKAALWEVQCQKLPTLMAEANCPKIELVDSLTGDRYVVEFDWTKPKYSVSLPGEKHIDKRLNVYKWLREIGQGGIIKKTVEFPMGTLDDEKVRAFIATVQEKYPSLEAGIEDKVASASLRKLVTSLKKEGKNVHEDLTVYEIREASVSPK